MLKTAKSFKDYLSLLSLCFYDPAGWIDRLLPLPSTTKTYGIYEGKRLTSGIMSHTYETRIFGVFEKMSGIGGVASYPPSRNRGQIRELLSHILQKNYKAGIPFSSLYPFSFSFYEKTGYGFLGNVQKCSFDPRDIMLTYKPPGEFKLYTGSKKEVEAVHSVIDTWVAFYNFGAKPRRVSAQWLSKFLKFAKETLFIYYEGKTAKAVLQYKLVSNKPFITWMEMRRMAWVDDASFLSLFSFLRSYRDQCENITCLVPPGVPLQQILREPRITMELHANWMARPVNVKRMLELKVLQNPVQHKLTFSVRDELIPSNTAEYVLEGKTVLMRKYKAENEIDFPVFSSILFGAYSLREAVKAGKVRGEFKDAIHDFFRKEPAVFLTEMF